MSTFVVTNVDADFIEDKYDYVTSYTFSLADESGISTHFSGGVLENKPTMTVDVYNDRGILVYSMDSEAENISQARQAENLFYDVMGGSRSTNVEYVTSQSVVTYGTEYSTNDYKVMGTTGDAQYVSAYSWARYKANLFGPHTVWGGQSATWNLAGTVADYIKLHQSIRVQVNNAETSITISWPPGFTTAVSTSTESIATWSSEADRDSTGLGAQRPEFSIESRDVGGGDI